MAELRQACPGSARLGRLLHQEAGRRCRTPPATPACQPPGVRPRSRGPAGRPLGPPLARSAPALRCGTLLPGDGRLGNGARDVIPPASQSEALPRRDVPPPGPSPSPGARAGERGGAHERRSSAPPPIYKGLARGSAAPFRAGLEQPLEGAGGFCRPRQPASPAQPSQACESSGGRHYNPRPSTWKWPSCRSVTGPGGQY